MRHSTAKKSALEQGILARLQRAVDRWQGHQYLALVPNFPVPTSCMVAQDMTSLISYMPAFTTLYEQTMLGEFVRYEF